MDSRFDDRVIGQSSEPALFLKQIPLIVGEDHNHIGIAEGPMIATGSTAEQKNVARPRPVGLSDSLAEDRERPRHILVAGGDFAGFTRITAPPPSSTTSPSRRPLQKAVADHREG